MRDGWFIERRVCGGRKSGRSDRLDEVFAAISGLRDHDRIGESVLVEAAKCYPDCGGVGINGYRRALVKRERSLAGTIPLVIIVIPVLAGAGLADVEGMSKRLTAIARSRKHDAGSLNIGSVVEEDCVSDVN